jgi:hypothetical protein
VVEKYSFQTLLRITDGLIAKNNPDGAQDRNWQEWSPENEDATMAEYMRLTTKTK